MRDLKDLLGFAGPKLEDVLGIPDPMKDLLRPYDPIVKTVEPPKVTLKDRLSSLRQRLIRS